MSKTSSLINYINIDCSEKAFESSLYTIMVDSRKRTQIILEGYYDYVVLNKFFCPSAGLRFVLSAGRGNVTKILKRLALSRYGNIVGIADRDYDVNPYSSRKIFYYDYNNFEMMMVSDDNLFSDEAFYPGSYSEERRTSLIRLRDNILSSLFPKSIARLVNSRYCANNSFAADDVTPDDSIYFHQTREQNCLCIKNNICRILANLNNDTLSSIISNYDSEATKQHCYYDITQGHDFVHYFRSDRLLSCSEKSMYEVFAKAYKKGIFEHTNLCNAIKQYELTEGIKLLV